MTDPFLGEIRVFPFGFQPVGWASCNGQLMAITQNTALYSILGIVYGGDGRSTFGLPDLNGRAVAGVGQGSGLSWRFLGDQAGTSSVTLRPDQMPSHNHLLRASGDPAESQTPSTATTLARAAPGKPYGSDPNAGRVQMAPLSVSPAGGGQAHNNMPPVLAMNFCIALQGVFPQRP